MSIDDRPKRLLVDMQTRKLTPQQCDKISRALQPATGYLSRLKARIQQTNFPDDPELRAQVEKAYHELYLLSRMLHERQCYGHLHERR